MTRFDKTWLRRTELQSYVRRYDDFKYLLCYSFLVDYAEEMKISASTGLYSLAIILSVNNFQTPEIQAVLTNFFFVTVMILQVVVIGVEGGLSIGVKMEYKDN